MAALAWLLIPVVAAMVASLWARWAGRNRKVGDVAELAGYARFREAMEKSHSDPRADSGSESDSDAA